MTAAMTGSTPANGKIDFSKLSVVFSQLGGDCASVERHLGILGIRTLRVGADYDKTCRTIDRDKPDLVLCGMRPGQAEAHSLMRGIRHQDIGANPFPILISIADPMSPGDSASAINTGLDSLLVAPFDRDSFVRRVTDLAYNRKKFVAAPGYIGPTRRVSTRVEVGAGEEFDVPNPVHASGTGMSREELWRQISAASQGLTARKLSNDVAAIRRLFYELAPDYEAGNINDHFHRRIKELYDIVGMIQRRGLKLGNRDLVSMCELANNVLGEIKERPTPPNLKHLRALPKLVSGFQMALMALPERKVQRAD
jgi:DNA-binding response OmpR family regulator